MANGDFDWRNWIASWLWQPWAEPVRQRLGFGAPVATPTPQIQGMAGAYTPGATGAYTPMPEGRALAYPGVAGAGFIPTTVPMSQYREPWQEGMTIPYPTARTPVEQALADVGAIAAGAGKTAAGGGAAGPERGYQYAPGEEGYWAAIGQRPGNYPVPTQALAGMPGWRRGWEAWSWNTRGIPLQGYEIWRLSGNRPPWGGQPRPAGQARRGGGGGGGEGQQGAWQPGGWNWAL